MENYFKLTEESRKVGGVLLYRVQLTKDCIHGKSGDLGGWIEKPENLKGGWVSGDAQVYGDAWVFGEANVFGNARISQGDHKV